MSDGKDAESDRLSAAVEGAACGPAPASQGNIEQLFKDHNEALLRFLRVKLHSPQEALDVAQEVYGLNFSGLPRFHFGIPL